MDNMKLKSRMSGKVQEIQQPVEVVEAAPMIPANSGYLALNNDALEIIRENLKNQPLSYSLFDVVKSPSGGATVFEVPGLAGAEAEKELVGVVLDYTTPRAYWDTPDPVEGTPQVCMSNDSLISRTGRSAPGVRSTISAPRMERAMPRLARNRCCCFCCGPTASCRFWFGFRSPASLGFCDI